MSTPFLYRVVDIGEGLVARLTGKPKPAPALQRMTDAALDMYETLTGRQDVPDRVESRELVVPATDEPLVQELGAVKEGDVWKVPEGLSIDPFKLWWPQVPEDLRDRNSHNLTTKDGDPIEAYLRASDTQRGDDSTATPLHYGFLIAIAALSYFMGSIHPVLGLAMLPLALPFLIALTQGEGISDAIRSALMLLIGPLALANGVNQFRAQFGLEGGGIFSILKGVFTGEASTLLSKAATLGMVGLASMVAMLFLVALWTLLDSKRKQSLMGASKGYWYRFKANVKWAVVGTIGLALSLAVLPPMLYPFFIFAMLSFYPLVHTQANFNGRTKELAAIGNEFRLARMGQLTNVHLLPRINQAKAAVADKTPVIHVATATGWLTKKRYPLAPDEDQKMVLSALDSHSHVIIYGDIGVGKTSSVMRPWAKQWIESGAGGFLCLCGKGALPGEISALIDLMIRPGVDYAPLQGLNATGLAAALNSIQVDSKGSEGSIWDGGAKTFIDHLTTLLEALHQHEQHTMVYYAYMTSEKEKLLDYCLLEVIRRQKLGQDASDVQVKVDALREQIKTWRTMADLRAKRRWLWNIDTLTRLSTTVNNIVMRGGAFGPSKELLEALEELGYMPSDPKRAQNHPDTIHPELGTGSLLDGTIEFFTKAWPQTDERQRSSFMINVNARLLPLTRGRFLVGKSGVHWKMLEKGEDVGVCLYGKSVGVDLPDTLHGAAGLAITTLAKQRVFDQVRLRSGKSEEEWMAEGQKPLTVMMDEAHLLVGDQEASLATISRSLRMSFVIATQTYENLIKRFGGDENSAAQFDGTFQSFICLKSSPKTYERIRERLGKAELVSFYQQAAAIDYKGALTNFALSPLNDPDHYTRGGMEHLLRMGFGNPVVNVKKMRSDTNLGWSGVRTLQLDEETMIEDMPVPTGGRREVKELFEEQEFFGLLSKGQAIVCLNRAGERRVDLAKLPYIGPNELRKALPDVTTLVEGVA